VKRQLSGIKGVVEINTWGGYLKQYEIAISPSSLKAINISMTDVFTALEKNNSIAGGAYIEKVNQSYFIRGEGKVKSLADIENIVVKNNNGLPVYIKNIAQVLEEVDILKSNEYFNISSKKFVNEIFQNCKENQYLFYIKHLRK
jgi:cobalt-zinc-cadmium resistance protein CzcA